MTRVVLAILFGLMVAACAHHGAYTEGLELIEAGKVEAGLAKLEEAAASEPRNREYRQALVRHREVALQRYLAFAESARLKGQWAGAEEVYRRMLAIEPANARARAGIEALAVERERRGRLAAAEEHLKKDDIAAAEAAVRAVLSENATHREAQQLLRRIEERKMRAAQAPELSAALQQPISLEFRDGTLKQIFEAISRSAGVNFIFDRDVRTDTRTTIFVRNSSIEEVMRFMLVTNQLERKVLSENTLLVYPNTAAKARDYQELVVKSFYLSNADAKSTAAMIRALVKTKDVYIDEKLNVVVMRDTPEAVRVAERLVANHDLAEAEVMLEVEVLEVSSNSLYNLGIQYPDSVSFSLVGAAGTPGTVTLREWHSRNSDLVRLTVSDPFLAFNFRNEIGRSNILANPRIRVKNKDKAKIHIGDKVPVITTTAGATGFVSESVNYLDVGLKLDVEPIVFLENEVGIKVGLEVSNIVREIRGTSGTLTYQVGTRTASTSLRLKDGETQILAGLISDEDRKTASQIPGLGDLPVVGRLFGSHLDTANKTEIVLLITPRVIRGLAQPELQFSEFHSGTEAAIGAPQMMLRSTALERPGRSPASAAPKTPALPRVLLQAPASVPAGEQLDVIVSLETANALRAGLLDFAFDPSRLKFVRAAPGSLVTDADRQASFRVNAPEALGRLNLSFAVKADLQGRGELAKLRFEAVGSAAGARTIRLEALTFTTAAGQVVNAPAPPPVSLSIAR
jgi:general secretion pathway protein D